MTGDTVRERGRHHPVFLRFHVRLSKPTSRPVSVVVRDAGGVRHGARIADRSACNIIRDDDGR